MFKDIFHQVNGIDNFPIIIMLFCFAFFIGVVLFAFRLDKEYVSHMENLPLDETGNSNNHGSNKNA